MRRITSMVICILMLVMLAIPAAAAEVPTFKLVANKEKLEPGESVIITVEAGDMPTDFKCSSFAVIVKYNDPLEFVSVKADSNKGGMIRELVADPSLSEYDGKFPGVGGWNVNPQPGTEPGQSLSKPAGKVGQIELKSFSTKPIEDVTKLIEGVASYHDGSSNEAKTAAVEISIMEGMLGDVNEDGKVTVTDIVTLRNGILGRKALTDQQKYNADVNFDGKTTVTDIVSIRNFILGRITTFE